MLGGYALVDASTRFEQAKTVSTQDLDHWGLGRHVPAVSDEVGMVNIFRGRHKDRFHIDAGEQRL